MGETRENLGEITESSPTHRVKIAIGPSGLLDWELVDLILGKQGVGVAAGLDLG